MKSDEAMLGTARIEAFSDGVLAIVITLLVLEIRVPELSADLVSSELAHRLWEMTPKFVGFITSFLVVGVYWVAHHNVFHYIARSDQVLPWLNLLTLMCICFIPFPTALIGEYPRSTIAVALYGGTLTICAIAFNILWWYVSRDYRLLNQNLSSQLVKRITRDYFLGIFPYLIAFVLAFFNSQISIFLYIATTLTYVFLNSRHALKLL